MLGFGKTTHDSIAEATATAFDPDREEDCAHIVVEIHPEVGEHCIQFLHQPDGDTVHNVTYFEDEAEKAQCRAAVDLVPIEDGDGFILFGSEATSPAEAEAEIRAIVEALAPEAPYAVHTTATKSFKAFDGFDIWERLRSLVPV